MMMDKKKLDFLDWFLIIGTAISVMFIFLVAVVSAADWPFGKAKFCEVGNLTGIECERYWCNFNDANYSDSRELCLLVINETIILNETNQTIHNYTEISLDGYYNRTDIDMLITDNMTNISKTFDNKLMDLRDSLSDRVQNIVNGTQRIASNIYSQYYPTDEGSKWHPAWIVAIVVIIVGGIGFLAYQEINRKRYKNPNPLKSNFVDTKMKFRSAEKKPRNARHVNEFRRPVNEAEEVDEQDDSEEQ